MSSAKFRGAATLVLVLLAGMLTAGAAQAADSGVQATFGQSLDAVHKAAIDALAVIGCTINKDEASEVAGRRARKVGLLVGSGGETVTVSLAQAADGKVTIDVRTAKTFVGGAGQKNWDQAVVDEISKALAAPAAPPAPSSP